ncbi:Flp family type IVb pilin [Aeromicrobium sp. YIM 150415]|nr:Flp family type IVb pilin [Aeromicrobium sp. YIM 150415]
MSFAPTSKREERGATAVEYGLIVALIAAIIIGLVATLGTEIKDAFQDVINGFQGTGTGGEGGGGTDG